jgi:hypothetical protein
VRGRQRERSRGGAAPPGMGDGGEVGRERAAMGAALVGRDGRR